MQKNKTQSSVRALSGLQGDFNFEQNPFSPNKNIFQRLLMRGYRIDRNLLVAAVEAKHG